MRNLARYTQSFSLFVVLGTALSLVPQCNASPDLSQKILRAARFEEQHTVAKLSQDFRFRGPDDIQPFTAILEACALVKCSRDVRQSAQGTSFEAVLPEFADAWVEFSLRNPRLARDRFRKLATHPRYGWIGAFGLLRYAVETDNVSLLQSTISESSRFLGTRVIDEEVQYARIRVAFLENDYERGINLLRNVPSESEVHLLARFDYLIWNNDLSAARKMLSQYVQRFGFDHNVASSNIELKKLTSRTEEIVAEIDRTLQKHPRYWRLRLERIAHSLETSKKAVAELPTELAYVRLLRDGVLILMDSNYAREFTGNLTNREAQFEDYPIFHVIAATALRSIGRTAEASARLSIAEKQSPLLITVMYEKAVLAEAAGRIGDAIKLYHRIANFAPYDAQRKLSLATALYGAGQYAEAKIVIDQIQKLNVGFLRDFVRDLEKSISSAKSIKSNKGQGSH